MLQRDRPQLIFLSVWSNTLLLISSVGLAAGGLISLGFFLSPVALAAALIIVVLTTIILSGRQDRVLGVASIGSLTILTLLPAGSLLGTSATYGGPSLAVFWISVALIRRGRVKVSVAVFLVTTLMTTNLVSSLFLPPESVYYYIPVLLLFAYSIVSSNMNFAEKRMTQKGILLIAMCESVIATIEILVLGRPPLARAVAVSDGNPFVPGIERAQGTTGHPLVLGLIIVVGLAVALLGDKEIGRRLRLISLPLLALGFLFSGSVSPLLVALLVVIVKVIVKLGDVARSVGVISLLVGSMVFTLSTAGTYRTSLGADQLDIAHRVSTIQSVPELFTERPIAEVLLGSGIDSPTRLYDTGVLNNDGFYAVDNQYIRTFIEAGLLGVSVLVAFLLFCWVRGNALAKVVILVSAITFFSFDVLVWSAPIAAILLLTIPSQPEKPDSSSRQPLIQGSDSGRRISVER